MNVRVKSESQAPVPWTSVRTHYNVFLRWGHSGFLLSKLGPECFWLSLTICPMHSFNLEQCFLYSETGNRTSFFLPATRHIFVTPQVLKCPHLPHSLYLPKPSTACSCCLRSEQFRGGLWVSLLISQACAHSSLLQHALCTFLTRHNTALIPRWMSHMGEFEAGYSKNPSRPTPQHPTHPAHIHTAPLQTYFGTKCSWHKLLICRKSNKVLSTETNELGEKVPQRAHHPSLTRPLMLSIYLVLAKSGP